MPALTCRSCGAQLDLDTLDDRRGVAVCRFCHTVNRTTAWDGVATRRRYEVEQPEGFELTHRGDGVRIVHRWRRWVVVPLLIVLVLMNLMVFLPALAFLLLFGLFAVVALIGAGDPAVTVVGGLFGLFAIAVAAAMVAIGAVFHYVVLAMLINRTVIEVDGRELRVRYGPLPWRGGAAVPADRVEQLYCKERSVRTQHGSHPAYELHAGLIDGGHRRLLAALPSLEHAIYVEQQLERAMGITDRAVAGEVV